ncbi:MAG TPA: carboxypeptidase regulatory-like domain-containing protein [Gemmatimonadaceae bacterium]|nr:carboxypeptidase regulatory-like domain-containing protein [Gemmatimonadaceae bacterium]
MTLLTRSAFLVAAAVAAVPLLAQQPTAPAPAPTPPAPTTGLIVGFVFDSTIMRPLAEASIQLAAKGDLAHGKSFNATSDSSGFFRVTDVPPGEYLATFFHERLDALGLEGPVRSVTVTPGRNDVELGIPGARRVIGLHCGPRPRGDSSGVILGTVTKSDLPDPVPNATVTAQWFELSIGTRGMTRSTPTVRATTDANGRFAFCGLPPDANFSIWASAGRAMTGTVSVDVPASTVATTTLALDVADTMPARDSTGALVRRGTARISGVVRMPSGSPLAGARVGLRGTYAETVADAHGAYTLTDLPGGTQTLEARAIGYIPVSRTVRLSGKRPTTLDVQFDKSAQILETVEVRGKAVLDRATEEFNTAKKRGFGYFLDREAIEQRQAFQTSDLLRTAPGVMVFPGAGPGGPPTIQIRGSAGFSGVCQPGLVIDGLQFQGGGGDLDMLVRPEDIAGMAVYRGASETPVEYQGISSCGVIQVWTRRGNTPHGKTGR